MPIMETRTHSLLRTPVVTLIVPVLLIFYAVHGQFSFLHSVNGALFLRGANLIDVTDSSENTVTRVLLAAVTFIIVFLTFPFTRRIIVLLGRNLFLTAMVLLAVTSALWSQDPIKTLEKSAYLLLNLWFAAYLCERFRPAQLMRLFVIAGAIAMAASIFLVSEFPRFGLFHGFTNDTVGWEGIFFHKNQLGAMTVYLLTAGLFLPFREPAPRLRRGIYICVALILVAFSQSRGAWVLCLSVLAFAALVKFGRRFGPRDRRAIYMGTFTLLLVLATIAISYLPEIFLLMNKDMTMTGRTKIWQALLVSMSKRPLLGFGYSAFWLGPRGESARVMFAVNWTGIGYAENGLIELCLELGAAGAMLFGLLYIQAYRRLRNLISATNGRPELLWYASILFITVIANIDAGNIATFNTLDWLIFMMTTIGIEKYYHDYWRNHLSASLTGSARLPFAP